MAQSRQLILDTDFREPCPTKASMKIKKKAVTCKMLNVKNLPHLALAGKTILMMAVTENCQEDGCFLRVLRTEQ